MDKSEKIAALNDEFRKNIFRGISSGIVILTRGVANLSKEMPTAKWMKTVNAVRNYSDFEPGDDPYGEHDFGHFESGEFRFFWKIDYYDKESLDFEKDTYFGSEDPADPEKTTRILTLMLADEY